LKTGPAVTNVATVQALYDAFAQRDTVAIRLLFDPQIEWVQNAGFPNGGRNVVRAGRITRFRQYTDTAVVRNAMHRTI
jgi:ketosteroid isomerase-like protein